MQNNLKRASSVFGAVAFMLTLSACPTPPECEVNDDCEGTDICSEQGTCEPDPRPARCDNGLITCSAEQVCDTDSGECKSCTATAGCSGETPICDTAANNGMGVCKTCTDAAGCGESAPICDTAANGGAGMCIVCNAELGCAGAPVCDPAANGGIGECVECTDDPQCSGGTPFCTGGACVACNNTDMTTTGQDEGCTVESPICDTTGAAPACRQPTCAEDAAYCVGCVTNADCSVSEFCGPPTPASQCEPAAILPADASTDIADIHAATPGPQVPGKPVEGALVTYIKPAIGDEPAGFFVQAEAAGPALFVQSDPSGVAIGDKVSFTVDHVLDDNTASPSMGFVDTASVISGLSVISSDHPVQNLNTATPAGLKVDVSAEPGIVGSSGAMTDYENELFTMTGTLVGPVLPSGNGFVQVQIATAGVPDDNRLRARFPETAFSALHMWPGCEVTITNGVYWRSFSDYANPATYSAGDVTVNSCPTPEIVRAAATGPLEVTVFFNRPLDQLTVAATDFTIAGLTIATAVVVDNKVTLTTTAMVDGDPYTVGLSDSVSDTAGTANVATSSAAFTGRGAGAKLVINEVDYDQAGTDATEFIEIYNAGGAAATLTDLQVILLNLTSTSRLYRTIALSGAVDAAGDPATSLPAGGYLVIADNATLLSGLPAGVLRVTTATASGGWFQNGDPDGLALWDNANGALLDTLSYEGDLGVNEIPYSAGTRTEIPAQEGTVSTRWIKDAGFGIGSVRRLPNGFDSNSNGDDFAPQDLGGYPTQYSGDPTPGVANQ